MVVGGVLLGSVALRVSATFTPVRSPSLEMAEIPSGSWGSSDVTAEDIEYLRHSWMLPSADRITARPPANETAPEPQEGEFLVFATHFPRGFGLSASIFFNLFLETFELQPHHLGRNSIL